VGHIAEDGWFVEYFDMSDGVGGEVDVADFVGFFFDL
jgi:hypothetical protein